MAGEVIQRIKRISAVVFVIVVCLSDLSESQRNDMIEAYLKRRSSCWKDVQQLLELCEQDACAKDEFSCWRVGRTKSGCLPESLVCDGIADCVDGSDETERLCSASHHLTVGMNFSGWVHWPDCFKRDDHLSRMHFRSVTNQPKSGLQVTVQLTDYVIERGVETPITFTAEGHYSHARRSVILDSGDGLVGDCRFPSDNFDRLHCTVTYRPADVVCSTAVLIREVQP